MVVVSTDKYKPLATTFGTQGTPECQPLVFSRIQLSNKRFKWHPSRDSTRPDSLWNKCKVMWVMALPLIWAIRARCGTREACVIVSTEALSASTTQSRWSVYLTDSFCVGMAHKTTHSTHSAVLSSSEMRLNGTSTCSILSSVTITAKSSSKIAPSTARTWTNVSWTTPRTSARAFSLQVNSALNNQVLMPKSSSQSNTRLMLCGRRCALKRTPQPRRIRSSTRRAARTRAATCEPSPLNQIPVQECLTASLCRSTKNHSVRSSSRRTSMRSGATFPCTKPLWPLRACERRWCSMC